MRSLARRLAGRAGTDRLRTYARRSRDRLRTAPRSGGGIPGMLSLVVPVYNVEEYLDACLSSLRAQDQENLEIIVVDDGSPDGSIAIARRHRLRDPRIRIVRRPNGGLSAARNTGVAAARGEFLAFADSDDLVPPKGYAAAVASLRRSGSDFAVLPYQRLRRGTVGSAPRWIQEAHRGPRIGIRLEEFPDIMVNAIMCSKVFRRDFWHDKRMSFVEGIIYEDQQVSAEAYARAEAFDVLTVPVYTWRSRDDRTSISQSKAEASNLRAQLAAANASVDVLRKYASTEIVTQRVVQLLSNDMPQFTRLVVGCSDDFWELLGTELPVLQGLISERDYLTRVPAQQKVLNHLIAHDQREAAAAFLERGGLGTRSTRLGRESVGHVMYLPLWRDRGAGVPDECFLLADTQTRPRSSVRAITVTGPTTLDLYVYAMMQNVDLAETGQRVRAFAQSSGQADVELEVRSVFDPAVDEFQQLSGSGHCDYRNGALHLTVDAAALGSGAWTVRLELTVGPLTRSLVLGTAWQGGTGASAHAVSAGAGRSAVARVREGARGWFTIRVVDDGVVAETVRLEGRTLTLTGHGAAPDRLVARRRDGGVAVGTVAPTSDRSGWTAALDVGRGSLVDGTVPRARPGSWRVVAERGGVRQPVRYGPVDASVEPAGSPLTWAPVVGAGGALSVQTWEDGIVVTSVRVDDDSFVVGLDAHGVDLADFDAVFTSTRSTLPATLDEEDGAAVARLPFLGSRWGVDGQLVEPGAYVLRLVRRGRDRHRTPRVAARVARDLPVDTLTERLRGRFVLRGDEPRHLVVEVAPPLAEAERGVRNQLSLQAMANAGRADEPAVFFRTLYGETATDSALAVHRELRRRGSGLTLYWSVRDRSVTVPEGGVALVEGTREWHERLGAARFVMVNVHQPMWYRKPAGQVMVQTFHGYPYKGMGRSWWRRSQLPADRISSFLDRAEAWDFLVSPATYATPHLREAFFRPDAASRARVLESGYPRNDVLVSGDEQVRARVRSALDIRPDQTAVLYAPTFRDYLSGDGMTAAASDFLDPVEAARLLGDDFVLLVRGHAFNARGNARRVSAGGVRDVTYYPDINDLCLASDAAVLDYSSLRFDYALLRRPMVFLVPDRERYHAMRPAILDFDETAPGPQVTTTAEVVARLRDLASVRRDWDPQVERFLARYADLEDGAAAARVVDAVFEPGGVEPPARS